MIAHPAVLLYSPSGAGKTSLAEAMLFDAGAITRLGKVSEGNTTSDYEPEEIKRKITISCAFHHYQWKKHAIYLADTPGDDNFLADTRAALHVGDAAVVVVDAVDGVKVGTEKVWQTANHYNLPRLLFINKLDRERALCAIREQIAVPLGIDVYEAAEGVVELFEENLKGHLASAVLSKGYAPIRGQVPEDPR